MKFQTRTISEISSKIGQKLVEKGIDNLLQFCYNDFRLKIRKVNMNFGNQMRALRILRGLTQGELAIQVGISRPYISAVECGTLQPTPETEQRIREALEWDEHAEMALAMLAQTAKA